MKRVTKTASSSLRSGTASTGSNAPPRSGIGREGTLRRIPRVAGRQGGGDRGRTDRVDRVRPGCFGTLRQGLEADGRWFSARSDSRCPGRCCHREASSAPHGEAGRGRERTVTVRVTAREPRVRQRRGGRFAGSTRQLEARATNLGGGGRGTRSGRFRRLRRDQRS